MSYKKNFIAMIGIIALGLLGIAIFNYKIDPAGLFRSREYENGIAYILISKQNVANISNYDERLVQKYFIEKSIEKRDVLVFGSSRVMFINEYFFPYQTFFNHGVSGATIEDHIAIFTMYKERNWIPQKVIIGLDPWLLNKYHGQNRWQSLYKEYNNANAYLELENNEITPSAMIFLKKYMELISLPYFTASLLKQFKNQQDKYYPTIEKESNVFIKLADGTMSYPQNIRNISVEDAKKKATSYVNSTPVYSLENFKEIDKGARRKFEIFIEYLQNHNVKILFILPPYHPLVYDYLINNPNYFIVLEIEKYFRNFAQQQNIPILGSYNPIECGLSEMDFYDGMHATPQAITKIFELAPHTTKEEVY